MSDSPRHSDRGISRKGREMLPTSSETGTVVAVFPREKAEEAVRLAQQAGGDRVEVRLARPGDTVDALRSEMRQEVEHTIMGPGPVGPFTPQMTAGVLTGVLVWAVVGALVLLPFAFIPIGGLSLVGRILIAVVTGLIAGGTFGLTIGGGHGARLKNRGDLAAERGVTVAVESTDPQALARTAETLSRAGAIRVDVVADHAPVGTVTTEEETPSRAVESVGVEHLGPSWMVRKRQGRARGKRQPGQQRSQREAPAAGKQQPRDGSGKTGGPEGGAQR